MKIALQFAYLLFVSATLIAAEPQLTLRAKLNQPGAQINPAMWGVFFEDINFAADGGVYAELVKNGSFEFPDAWMGWTKPAGSSDANLSIHENDPAFKAQPHYLRIKSTADDPLSISNVGFRGIGAREQTSSYFSVTYRQVEGQNSLRVELEGADGSTLSGMSFSTVETLWRRKSLTLPPGPPDTKATLRLTISGDGTLDLDRVSLFPSDTWRGRTGGLRNDLVQMLADMRPGFVRFPGGCIVEGRDLANRYQWKNTIGDVGERPLILNRWNNELERNGRGAKDYYQSFGLGFYEYFRLCEDIGAAPLPILNCGMACQFNTGELCPLDQLDEYIQDALDLIEFANGSPRSTWGAKRLAMGHPDPFKLTMLGIGNEQWGPQFVERYARFSEVLKQKHPEIQLIGNCGPNPAGEGFEFLWSRMRQLKANLVDEHYYKPADWFLANATRYDNYDRSGPKVFAGEYAVHLRNRANSLESALAEAAAMTGFERNADVVRMSSYAPLFAHIDAWQWRPNLIWFDNVRVMGTPNYYVQQLFSRNRGDRVVPLEIKPTGSSLPEKVFSSAVWDDAARELVIKVVNAGENPCTIVLDVVGATSVAPAGKLTLLTSAKPTDENSLDQPWKVYPATRDLGGTSASFTHEFPAYSVSVLRLPCSL